MEEEYKKCLENIKNTNPSDSQKLELYGLFKQINYGDNNSSKPWSWQLKESFKWQAWKNNIGKSEEKCMELYIMLYNKIK